jgi:hypothetical protein
VTVDNASAEDVTLVSLADDVFGDLLDPDNPLVSDSTCPDAAVLLAPGASFSCRFEAFVAGSRGDPDHVDTVTATVTDDDGNEVSESDQAVIGFVETTAIVTGHVFVDLDGDGVQDPAEPDLVGVDVAVTDADGNVVVVTTDEHGDWSLTVPIGETAADVDESTVPEDYVLTTGNDVQTVDVPPGGAATEDVGYQPPLASVSGTLWLDIDGDAAERHPLEPPLPGVRVLLVDADGNVVDEVVTDAEGSYEFTGLIPTAYTILVDETTIPAGIAVVADPDSDADGITDIEMAPGEHLGGQDFVYRGIGEIGDTVWVDTDGDGIPDDGEPRLEGAEVTLVWAGLDGIIGTGDDWTFVSQQTGSDGTYRFTGLPPGVYRVAIDIGTVDAAYSPTTLTTMTLALDPGETDLTGDFGFAPVDQALPYTGVEAARIAVVALLLAAVGLVLNGAAGIVQFRRSLIWRRRVASL